MRPKRILITGATGFIGSRLCEMLSLDHHIPYRALVRNFSRAARIARLNAELAAGDTLEPESLEKAIQDCDAVVHLAHSDDKTAGKQAEHLVAVSKRARIQRFVHVSSMAVHGPTPEPGVLTEAAPIKRWGEAYSDAKAEVEAVVTAAVEKHAFPAVILRPTIVYGPYSFFVTPIVDDARQGRVSLIDGGRGICNAVYVDDVCNAILAALDNDSVLGEAFLINGDCRITWHDFITKFAGMVPRSTETHDHSVEEIDAHWHAREARARDSLLAVVRLVASPAFHAQLSTIPPLGRMIRGSKERISSLITPEQKVSIKSRLQGRKRLAFDDGEAPVKVPNRGRVIREAYRSWVSNDLAKAKLGWRPSYTFEQGAARTGDWLRFARMLTPRPSS
jgi:2-alkyl-3-oxoalkanoate reductase